MNPMPKWARRVLGRNAEGKIEAAVRKAESATTGEFVCVLVRRSSGTRHVALTCGLTLLLCFYILNFHKGRPDAAWRPETLIVIQVLTSALFGWLLSKFALIQRVFASDHDHAELSFRRARLEFFQHGLEKTKGATGVLLFVSLLEHRAYVLADKSIAKKVPANAWDPVVAELVRGAKDKNLAGGFERAVGLAANIVRPHFPRRGRNKNELSNRVIIKE